MEFKKYDDETLKHLQDVEMMILKDVIKVCEENDIGYCMYGGSLLGAIRHKGFIPWDDDIDILMLQNDYDRFIEVMQKTQSDKYELVNAEITPGFYLTFTKVMLKGTIFEEWWVEQVDFEQYINIDVFPLCNVSNNKYKRFFEVKLGRIYDRLLSMASIKLVHHPPATRFIANSIHHVLKFLGLSTTFFNKRLWKILNKYRDGDCEFVCEIGALNLPQVYRKADLVPFKKAKFEDIEVNIANDSDAILTQIFGDYMQLPPEEKRYNHAVDRVDFGKY